MKSLNRDIVNFFERQGFVIVSTINPYGNIHCSAKGIADIDENGLVYIIDLYVGRTFNNLKNNPTISITAIDEHLFIGYTLIGKAKIVEGEKINSNIIMNWEERLIKRISKRVIRNIKDDRKNNRHPESRFPTPKYLIEMEVEDIVDLTPRDLFKSFS
ncbi:MAG: pyridoxamine 5'-phosphate oxidase family protein [Candidatus Omnitrophica bacterium]|nr:pyridoxamine 5'-phosphate oxidase family protein [Candidatus Omnitrophota bacterium]MCM8826161.1 pyridoxamine 5'-phosphate oxidase family protein [Candidatus Omnitrophota bacterium]